MKLKNLLIQLSLCTALLTNSILVFANGEICKNAFSPTNSASEQIIKSGTVRDYYKKMGILKTETEILKLRDEEKFLYLSLLDLDVNKAQEIIRLFATFPILTGTYAAAEIRIANNEKGKSLKSFLKNLDHTRRLEISHKIAQTIVKHLGAKGDNLKFLLKEESNPINHDINMIYLDSHKIVVKSFGLPETMIKEIAQFFNPITESSKEFQLIQALAYQNFDMIAATSVSGISESVRGKLNFLQGLTLSTAKAAGIYFGLQLSLGPEHLPLITLAAWGITEFGMLNVYIDPSTLPQFKAKVLFSNYLYKARKQLSLKRGRAEIERGLLALTGLDPSAIKPLPSVTQLKKPNTASERLTLLPPLTDAEKIAYPEVDLTKLEDSFEKQISLTALERLRPTFENIDQLSSNPFQLLAFAKELDTPQILIIGREELLTEQFKEFSERLSVWQSKMSNTNSSNQKAALIDEKVRLTELLHHSIEENSRSWQYLSALEQAVMRYDLYLKTDIIPNASEATLQAETLKESFSISLLQISLKKQSLQQRSQALSELLAVLRL